MYIYNRKVNLGSQGFGRPTRNSMMNNTFPQKEKHVSGFKWGKNRGKKANCHVFFTRENDDCERWVMLCVKSQRKTTKGGHCVSQLV